MTQKISDISRRSFLKWAGSIFWTKMTWLPIDSILSWAVSTWKTLLANWIKIIVSNEITNHEKEQLEGVAKFFKKYPDHIWKYIWALKKSAKENYEISDIPDFKNLSQREIVNWFLKFSRIQSESLSLMLQEHIQNLPDDIIKLFPKGCIITPDFAYLDEYFVMFEHNWKTIHTPWILNWLVDIEISDYTLNDLNIEIGMEFSWVSAYRERWFHYYFGIMKKIDWWYIQETFFTTDINKIRSYINMTYTELVESLSRNWQLFYQEEWQIKELNNELREKYFWKDREQIEIKRKSKIISPLEQFLLSTTNLTPISEYQKQIQSRTNTLIPFEENKISL